MKWPVLALMAFASAALPGWLRRNPSGLQIIGFLIGFCPFFLGWYHLNMAIISWAEWPGYVKGLEVSIVDFLVVAVSFTLPRTIRSFPLLLSFAMAAYFFAALLSVVQSGVPMASLFYCWQLLKLYFLCTVLARACATPEFAAGGPEGIGGRRDRRGVFRRFATLCARHPSSPGNHVEPKRTRHGDKLGRHSVFCGVVVGTNRMVGRSVVASAVVVEISTGSRASRWTWGDWIRLGHFCFLISPVDESKRVDRPGRNGGGDRGRGCRECVDWSPNRFGIRR